jgi:hypothetical protein
MSLRQLRRVTVRVCIAAVRLWQQQNGFTYKCDSFVQNIHVCMCRLQILCGIGVLFRGSHAPITS